MKTYHLTNPYQRGDPRDDLKPLQVILRRAGLYRGNVDDVFGPATGDACYRAKYRLGYPKDALHHTGGQDLLNFLRGSVALPKMYVVRRRLRGYGLTKAAQQRIQLVQLMRWAIAHEPSIHYLQSRPAEHMRQPLTVPWWSDCSELVNRLYSIAGIDIMGNNFSGIGNTDTLLGHGWAIPTISAQPGDVVVWPPWSPSHHTALVMDISSPRDPLLCSHGMERGPFAVRLSTETAIQRRPYVIRRYIHD